MNVKFADINIEALNCVVTIAWVNDQIDSWRVEKVVQTYDDKVFEDIEYANDVVEFFIGWPTLEREVKHYFKYHYMQVVAPSIEEMIFKYSHPSGECRTISITREDVIESMEEILYEKLSYQVCHCEPIGETNVVDCNCQDYIEEFTLVNMNKTV